MLWCSMRLWIQRLMHTHTHTQAKKTAHKKYTLTRTHAHTHCCYHHLFQELISVLAVPSNVISAISDTFPPGSMLICRSSANVEDLAGVATSIACHMSPVCPHTFNEGRVRVHGASLPACRTDMLSSIALLFLSCSHHFRHVGCRAVRQHPQCASE